jgi:DNA-binding PadR family transcriptional regulator
MAETTIDFHTICSPTQKTYSIVEQMIFVPVHLFYKLKGNMKETRLGDFEEVILLLVGILGEEAYAFKIAEEFESQTGRAVSIGSVHSTMDRLSTKGFLTSEMGQPSVGRGGRRKRIYTITASGQLALRNSKEFKMNLWDQYPALSFNLTN